MAVCTILFSLSYLNMKAQSTISSPIGEYYLQGVPETACGFKLDSDSSFQFFFSYGALDRFGQGRWAVKNGFVVFNSRPGPAHDFALTQSTADNKNGLTIQIKDENPVLLHHVQVIIKGNGKEQAGMTGEKGMIQFTSQPIDIIELVFEFCPEKKSVFTIEAKKSNYFEFRFEPWIMEVFFQNFQLHLAKDGFMGGHPFSDKTSFHYKKRR